MPPAGNTAASAHSSLPATDLHRFRATAFAGAGGSGHRIDGHDDAAMGQRRQNRGNRRTNSASRRLPNCSWNFVTIDSRGRNVDSNEFVQPEPESFSTVSRLARTCSICLSAEPSPTSLPSASNGKSCRVWTSGILSTITAVLNMPAGSRRPLERNILDLRCGHSSFLGRAIAAANETQQTVTKVAIDRQVIRVNHLCVYFMSDTSNMER